MIEISAPARIHAGLVGLSGSGYRINGGLGWSLEMPRLVLRARPAGSFRLTDIRKARLSGPERQALIGLLDGHCERQGFRIKLEIEISGGVGGHRGLGGGTALRLAMLEALHRLNGSHPEPSALIAASGRGGTSGVGITTYFEGGLVLDIGHAGRARPRPSHDWQAPNPPLQLLRLAMPDWRLGILAPAALPSVPHHAERALFERVVPIAHTDMTETLYQMIYGATGAVADACPATFAQAIDSLQQSPWKKAEWDLHGPVLAQMADQLRAAGARGIGLSSVGPSLYFLADQFEMDAVPARIADGLLFTRPGNQGRTIVEAA